MIQVSDKNVVEYDPKTFLSLKNTTIYRKVVGKCRVRCFCHSRVVVLQLICAVYFYLVRNSCLSSIQFLLTLLSADGWGYKLTEYSSLLSL